MAKRRIKNVFDLNERLESNGFSIYGIHNPGKNNEEEGFIDEEIVEQHILFKSNLNENDLSGFNDSFLTRYVHNRVTFVEEIKQKLPIYSQKRQNINYFLDNVPELSNDEKTELLMRVFYLDWNVKKKISQKFTSHDDEDLRDDLYNCYLRNDFSILESESKK
jgi:hypothetical protein